MKKFIGIFVVLAMVLAMLPMAAIAANTYKLSVGFAQYIELYAKEQITLVVNAEDKDVILTVDGEGSWFDWYIDNGMQHFGPEMNGAYKMKFKAGSSYEVTLVSDTGFDNQMLYVTLSAPEVGTEDNPAQLVMGESSIDLDGNAAYFYSFVASEDGKLDFAIDTTKSSDWAYQINVKKSGGVQYGDTYFSCDEEIVASQSVVVKAGDEVVINLNTCTWYVPYTVYFQATFTAGDFEEESGGEGGEGGDIGQIGGGDITVENEASTAAKPWTYSFFTEGPGSLRVVIGECNPGWRYKIEYPNGETSIYFSGSAWSVGPDYTHELIEAGQYKVMIWAYSASDYSNVDGTVSASITFTPAGGNIEIPKEEYVVSDILLGLGENYLTLDETAITTIYEFTPEETGLYKFIVDNEEALVGYWGAGSFFVWDQTENKINVIERELDAVGQSIMIGVSNVEGEFVMTVEKVGSVEEIEQIEYIEYVVKHVPLAKYLIDLSADQTAVPVDITKPQTVVKGSDGFYHLGSANGPIIYVNLISERFDLTQAFYGGYGALTMRGKYVDEDGNETYYEFLKAMQHYANVLYNSDYENGLYPMSEDLMIFLKAFGGYQGWYSPEQSGFEAIKAEHDPDSAWLVSCVTIHTPSDYRVTGSADWLGNWAADNEAGVMNDLGNGNYQATFSDVPAGDYELKITKGGTWDENWGANGSNGDNVKFSVGEGQKVTVTFNANTGEITVSLSGGEENPELGDYGIAALVVAMMAATAGAVVLTKKKEF